ncbi:MAG: hypothetical protein Kow0099_01020 [Candidatus Abyssubacteria bacterium]
MDRASVNPARNAVRTNIMRYLSHFSREKGIEERKESRRRTGGARSEKPLPPPDLVWVDDRREVGKFYLFPEAPILRRLGIKIEAASDMIVWVDPSNNMGLLEPSRLLEFLCRKTKSVSEEDIRSLSNELPPCALPSSRFQFKAEVLRNHQFVKDHFALRIRAGLIQRPVPGQFLQVMCDPAPHAQSPEYRLLQYDEGKRPRLRGIELLTRRPFLRRPFSIASYGLSGRVSIGKSPKLGAEWDHLIHWLSPQMEIIYRRLPDGAGTQALANRQSGEMLDIVGPLGRGFTLSPLPRLALLIGGGIGAPPLLFLAEELSRNKVEVEVFLGALTKARIPFPLRGKAEVRVPRFERIGLAPIISTDDGSAGHPGLVTDALLEYLTQRRPDGEDTKIFACGPRSMLAALDGIANRFNLPCEVLLEERMACGFGACISCVCAVKQPGQEARYTRICTEGPAFDAKTVMWYG